MRRRTLLGASLGYASMSAAGIASSHCEEPLGAASEDDIPLWPGTPPGGPVSPQLALRAVNTGTVSSPDRAIDQIASPVISVTRAAQPKAPALIIAPGGAYSRLMIDYEGYDVARRFSALGFSCFVLRYRLPTEGWGRRADVPLQDAQRAVRLLRANATRFDIDPNRIGFMGFSAGGHVACSIATHFGAQLYTPVDETDLLSARPDFSAPIYPLVTMGAGTTPRARDALLGKAASPELTEEYSCEKHVTAQTPPTWLCAASDDDVVKAASNTGSYYFALQASKVSSELHLFESGGHGFGVARTVAAIWPQLFMRWAAHHNFVTAAGVSRQR